MVEVMDNERPRMPIRKLFIITLAIFVPAYAVTAYLLYGSGEVLIAAAGGVCCATAITVSTYVNRRYFW